MLYLGEINDHQQAGWQQSIEIFEEGQAQPRTVALFPAERAVAVQETDIVRVDLSELQLHRPRQWGACWLACELYQELGLDEFWAQRLPPSRKGTRWDWVLQNFESNPPFAPEDNRKFGYRRDKRSDCVQVVIGLIVTPEGFPLSDEVLAGNTSDKTTWKGFLERIEKQYGKAQRIWVMDRGIPTEETLEQMRRREPPILYLVGPPKGRLSQVEDRLKELPWQQAREGVEVKLLTQTGEVYVLAQSQDRVNKERGMRRRQLKRLWNRLKELKAMELKRDALLMKLGAAKQQGPRAWRFVEVQLPAAKQNKKPQTEPQTPEQKFSFRLRKDKLRVARRREGRYLLRRNMPQRPPEQLWEFYLQLVQVEQAFKHLKGDLMLRPIYHRKEARIEAHIFVAFLAYCLHVTLGRRLRDLAPGLTPRSVLEKLAALQMIAGPLPTTDQREVILTRYTQPEPEQRLLLEKLKLRLPEQPPPRITAKQVADSKPA